MASSDTFPVDPDYGSVLSHEPNVLVGRVESARTYLRQKAAPRRVFGLVWQRHPMSDFNLIDDFYHKMLADFFTYHWKESALGAFTGRKFSVEFASQPVYQFAGFEQIDIRCEVIEKVGAAMALYPTFAGDYPFGNKLTAAATDLGAEGKLWIYAGYGYRVNGSGPYPDIFLDEVSQGGGATTGTSVPLGLHRLRVKGGTPTSLDYLI